VQTIKQTLFNALAKTTKSTLVCRGGISLIIRIMALVASTVSSIVLVRFLGPENFGLYSFIFAIITILAMPAQLGLPTLITRETARADTQNNWHLMKDHWRWSSRVILVGSIAIVACSALFTWVFQEKISAKEYQALLYGLALIPPLAFLQTRSAALMGLQHLLSGQLPDQIIRPLLLSLLVVIASLISEPSKVSATQALLLHSVAILIALMIAQGLLYHYQPFAIKNIQRHNPHQQSHGWWRALLPLSLTSGMFMISYNTDLIILGIIGTDTEVGLYKVALSASGLAFIGVTALRFAIMPQITQLFEKEAWHQLQQLMERASILCFVATSAAFFFFLFAGPWLLKLLYGPPYIASHLPLMILIISQCVFAFFGPIGALLFMTGQENRVLKILVATNILNIVLDMLWIPSYGLEGAATASSISMACYAIAFWFIALKHVKINSSVYAYVRSFFKPRNIHDTNPQTPSPHP